MQSEIFHREVGVDGAYTRKYTGLFSTMLSIARKEGVRKLFSGLTASLFGLVHVVIHFPLYENLKLLCRRRVPQAETEHGQLKIGWVLVCSTLSKSKQPRER